MQAATAPRGVLIHQKQTPEVVLSTNDIVTQLQTLFRYMEGDVSLYEATNQMLASGSECTETTLRELLLSAPINVLSSRGHKTWRKDSCPDISTGLDVVIDYQASRISMEEAVFRFCSETGMDENLRRNSSRAFHAIMSCPFTSAIREEQVPPTGWHFANQAGTGLLRSR